MALQDLMTVQNADFSQTKVLIEPKKSVKAVKTLQINGEETKIENENLISINIPNKQTSSDSLFGKRVSPSDAHLYASREASPCKEELKIKI